MVSTDVIEWADVVFSMERTHDQKLKQRFPQLMRSRKAVVLGIPDNYDYMSLQLLSRLRSCLKNTWNRSKGPQYPCSTYPIHGTIVLWKRSRSSQPSESTPPELRAAGVAHLRLFGSTARGDATQHSDVDLMAEFLPGTRVSLLTFAGLQQHLTAILGAKVDLSDAAWIKEHLRQQVLNEAVLAF